MYDPIPVSRRFSWLTPRERSVLVHLSQGLTVDEIAATDFVSVTTVRSQVSSMFSKLGVSTQVAAVTMLYTFLWESREAVDIRVAVTQVLEAAVA